MTHSGPTRVRFGVAVMMFITVSINYLDRSNLSIAATRLAGDLRFDPANLGLVFSGFGWAYALCQIPGGWLAGRVGTRVLMGTICCAWSVATLAQGLAGGLASLLGLRLLLGVVEAPTFPILARITTKWFPDRERAGAVGLYIAGQYAGIALLTPVLFFVQTRLGWRSVFFLTGAVGLVWGAFWLAAYRDPERSRRLGVLERQQIRAGGGWAEEAGEALPLAHGLSGLRLVIGERRLWGLFLGQFASNAVPSFFLTWFPTYLVRYRHFDPATIGLSSSMPFVAAVLGVMAGGTLSDFLVRRGVSPSLARKGPIVAGFLLSTSVLGANFVSDQRWVVFFLAVAFFGQGFGSITWVLVSLMAPRRLFGLVAGVFNFCGNLATVIVPLAIGFIIAHVGFGPALALVALTALGGVLTYVFLVGPVERIEIDRP